MKRRIMSIELFIIIGFLIFGFSLTLYFLNLWIKNLTKNQPNFELLEWLKSTNKRIDIQNKNITDTLQQSTNALNERLDKAARFIAAVQKNIGEMSEIGRGMKDLQDFLKSPKLRGNFGEQVLKELLNQMLPKQSFYMQYAFKSGAIVDAAIKTVNGIIPIDSKFPMENFQKMIEAKEESESQIHKKNFIKDVKKHIDDISKKYILTDEGTSDYALMYIPSESVYYEIVNSLEVFEYSSSKRVLPVSPMTFYAYLRAILMSHEGQKVEKQAKQILQIIRAIQKDYQKIEEQLGILNRHLTNAYNQMNNITTSFLLLGQKLSSTNQMEESDNNDMKIPDGVKHEI